MVNAGHFSLKMLPGRPGTPVGCHRERRDGLPLGVVPEYSYEATLPLQPGDTVSVYTDGVTDAMNPNDRMFGTDEVERYLSPEDANVVNAGRPALGERWSTRSSKHAGGRPQNDDIAVVCFGRLESETGAE